MTGIRVVLLLALGLLCVLIVSGHASAQGQNCNPPASGTWVIRSETVVCTGQVTVGNVTVRDFGSLTFQDCQLTVRTTRDYGSIWGAVGGESIDVEGTFREIGGRLFIRRCEVASSTPGWDYVVSNNPNSVLVIENSTFRDVYAFGLFEGALLKDNTFVEWDAGLVAWTGSPVVKNNLVLDDGLDFAFVAYGESTPVIENNTVDNCQGGLEIYPDSKAKFHHNTLRCTQLAVWIWNGGMTSIPQDIHFNDLMAPRARFCGDGSNNWYNQNPPNAANLDCMDWSHYSTTMNHPERWPRPAIAPLPATATRGQLVSFDGSASLPSLHFRFPLASYKWSFGDGATANGAQATHAYSGSGTFVVNLTVTDSMGLEWTASRSVVIPNRSPQVTSLLLDPAAPRHRAPFSAVAQGSDGDGDPLTFSFAWKRNGVLQADLTGPTVPEDRVYSGERWDLTATANDPYDGHGQATLSVQVTVNQPPAVTVSIVPGNPTAGTTLTANASANDPETGQVPVAYTWYRNFVEVEDLHGPTAPGDRVHARDTWTVRATAQDPEGFWGSQGASVTVPNGVPVINSFALSPTSPLSGQALQATFTASDPDGDAVTTWCTWKMDGIPQDVATCEVPVGRTRAGELWVATANANDNRATTQDSRSATIGNRAPTMTGLSLAPAAPRRGEDLVATATASDPDNHQVVIHYEWRRDGAVQGDLTTNTVPGARILKDATWTVVATPNDGRSDGIGSSVSVTVQNTAPAGITATVTPTSATVGQAVQLRLTATDTDGDSLLATWTLPDDSTLTGLRQSVTFKSAGSKTIRYELSDGEAPATLGSVQIQVANVPAANGDTGGTEDPTGTNAASTPEDGTSDGTSDEADGTGGNGSTNVPNAGTVGTGHPVNSGVSTDVATNQNSRASDSGGNSPASDEQAQTGFAEDTSGVEFESNAQGPGEQEAGASTLAMAAMASLAAASLRRRR